jgi:hypothetical protein
MKPLNFEPASNACGSPLANPGFTSVTQEQKPMARLSSHEQGEKIRDRLAKRGNKKCVIEFCFHERRNLSRWCKRHANREARHGAPQQRCIRIAELQPYAKSVRRFLDANQTHPALGLAFAALDKLLTDAAALPAPTQKPAPRNWRLRLQMELTRLHRGGVTGEEIFLKVATLHLFATYQPRSLEPHSRAYWFQASRLILSARHRRPEENPLVNKEVSNRLPATLLESLGRSVTILCWPVFDAMVAAMEKEAAEPKTHQARITEALTAQPFSPSPQPQPQLSGSQQGTTNV